MVIVFMPPAVLSCTGMIVCGSMLPCFLSIVRGFLLVVGGSGVVARSLGVIVRDLFYTGFLRQDGRRRPCRAR